MWCSFNTIEGHGEDGYTGRAMLCKRWSCPTCQPIRCAQLREKALAGKPNIFLTLTASDAAGDDEDEVARKLVRAWRNILQRGRREGRFQAIHYLCVFEATKRGRPHLHILIRGPYVPKAWISERMQQYMASPVCFIEKVTNRMRAARYVAKYVSKEPWRWQGTKRYWSDQKWRTFDAAWKVEAEAMPREWGVVEGMWFNRIRELQDRGWEVREYGIRAYFATPPPPGRGNGTVN